MPGMSYDQRPDADDLPHTNWTCENCGYENSCLDGECQNSDCTPYDNVPCVDSKGHHWVVSDENENVSYCSTCGCPEY